MPGVQYPPHDLVDLILLLLVEKPDRLSLIKIKDILSV